MQLLNLPSFHAKIKEDNGKSLIFDPIRKKYVVLTPEEWVRQHFIHYMISLGYPVSLIAVEKLVNVNGLRQRADLVLYNRVLKPALIVECKAPAIKIGQGVLEQAARYNISLGVSFLVVTNGIDTFCIRVSKQGISPVVVSEMPSMEEINGI